MSGESILFQLQIDDDNTAKLVLGTGTFNQKTDHYSAASGTVLELVPISDLYRPDSFFCEQYAGVIRTEPPITRHDAQTLLFSGHDASLNSFPGHGRLGYLNQDGTWEDQRTSDLVRQAAIMGFTIGPRLCELLES